MKQGSDRMLPPDVEAVELEEMLPLMTLDDLEEMLHEIYDRLRTEKDGQKLMRLLTNRDIVEKAIEKFY
ncbi:lysine N(6)-hydroxylase/L-ornithine N(5)-oxygenase family protein [Desulforamulus ferrireducens]|nr:lysine N(6)-hydroxylase/L-ornithine N(5)-oxygenase family protein [Desulforamulus ferrireducens]